MSPSNRQKGVIFLALVLVLFVASSTMVLGALNNRQTAYVAQQAELHKQMEIAKVNLLAYLTSSNGFFANEQGPGFFPCPDTDADGSAEASCNPTNTSTTVCGSTANRPRPQIGRLPRYVEESGYRIEISDYYKDPHQQFWYVVAPRYVYYTGSSVTNIRRARTRTSTSTTLTSPSPPPACTRLLLDDDPGYVAFIIAPGEELETQNRIDNPELYSNYLDGENGAKNYYYYTRYESNPALFNDQIVGITLDEYVKAVGMRVVIEMKKQMDNYYPIPATDSYPNLSNFRSILNNATDHTWLTRNVTAGWNGERWSAAAESNYQLDSSTAATISFAGCESIKFNVTHLDDATYPDDIRIEGDSCQ